MPATATQWSRKHEHEDDEFKYRLHAPKVTRKRIRLPSATLRHRLELESRTTRRLDQSTKGALRSRRAEPRLLRSPLRSRCTDLGVHYGSQYGDCMCRRPRERRFGRSLSKKGSANRSHPPGAEMCNVGWLRLSLRHSLATHHRIRAHVLAHDVTQQSEPFLGN